VTPKIEAELNQALEALKTELGQSLYSCCLYGSAVRGNAIEGVSDLNLLIVLNESSAAAHQAVARAIGERSRIDPFILGRRGLERSARAFATKFASIRRNYRVLHGADPLAGLKLDPELEKFLCEQAVRNLRLRLVYAFVTHGRHKGYDRFIVRNATGIFVQLSEALRLQGTQVPTDFEARIGLFEREYKIDGQPLRDLLVLKREQKRLGASEVARWHERLFPILDGALRWIEERW
jgi:hypothetical protein